MQIQKKLSCSSQQLHEQWIQVAMIQIAQVFTDHNPTQELHCRHYRPLVYHIEHVSGCWTPNQLNCQSCLETLDHQCLTLQELTQASRTSKGWQRSGTFPVFGLNAQANTARFCDQTNFSKHHSHLESLCSEMKLLLISKKGLRPSVADRERLEHLKRPASSQQ